MCGTGLLLLAGCGTADGAPDGGTVGQQSFSSTSTATTSPDQSVAEKGSSNRAQDRPPPEVRQGVPAASSRIRFEPESLDLPGGLSAPVQPAQTVDGELQIPENVEHVGWWDGSSYAGDPFGSTVIAGHIDSAEQGPGFFTRLLTMQVDEVVTVRSGANQQRYRVVSTTLVDKDALATDTAVFEQTGGHRLVLITCSGRWLPEVGSYESNFVVVAEPLGPAT